MRFIIIATTCLYSIFAWADPQTEIMADKLDRLEAEMALMQKKFYQKSESSAPSINNIDELYSQIDEQNTLIQELTSKMENLTHQLSDTQAQMQRLSQDVDFRFKEIKSPSDTSSDPTKASVEPVSNFSDQEDYDNAYNQLKAGEYDKAEKSFIRFMEQHASSTLIGNANYWLGETYYVRGKYEQAVGFFADGFTKYKENIKAPDSMFKLGLTFKNMKKDTEACSAFLGLAEEFPNATDTLKNRAKQEAKELKCP